MLDLDTLLEIGFSLEQGEMLVRQMERIKDVYGPHSDRGTRASSQDQRIVLAYALTVFGDPDKCVHWLCKKWDKIGGEIPLALIKSKQGCMDLSDALVKIDYGFFA